jgi:hypothetical protein
MSSCDCVLLMVMPSAFTSAGSRPEAVATRFCTSTAATSRSLSGSKVTVMVLVPLLLLVEEM